MTDHITPGHIMTAVTLTNFWKFYAVPEILTLITYTHSTIT